MPQDQTRGDCLLSSGGDGERILKRKSPGSCEGFEGDVVAEGLELGNGPTRFSSLVAAHGHAGLISKMQGTAVRIALSAGRVRPSGPKLCALIVFSYVFSSAAGRLHC